MKLETDRSYVSFPPYQTSANPPNRTSPSSTALASIQTALFNAPLVVIVGWSLGKDMDLNFEIFMIVLLVLSTVVLGNFLRDGESNYLEGVLLVVSTYSDTCDKQVLTYC